MTKSRTSSRVRLALMILLVCASSFPLTACRTLIVANDPHNECDHPEKPPKPYLDSSAGQYIAAQGEAIDKCRSLLGHDLPPQLSARVTPPPAR